MKSLAHIALFVACLANTSAFAAAKQCSQHVADYLDPASGKVITPRDLFTRHSQQSIVLLGEVHDNADHHRWQLNALSALHSRNANLVLGLEMLPREAQPALDAWTRGTTDTATFLEQSGWQENWGYDPGLYLPILHFARLNRLPAVAINIDRQLVSQVGDRGWDALADDERMGLSDPAPASPEYRRSLGELYRYKMLAMHGDDPGDNEGGDAVERVMQSEAFGHFVDAQLTWDRAMAEALADAHRADPDALVVAIVGRGHLEHGYGIPHQLADLGIDDVSVLLPIDAETECDALQAGLADAVFVMDAGSTPEPPARPRLGVMIEPAESGVRVAEVVDGSVAAASGLRAGDVIVRAAGFDTHSNAELVDIIQRQAPGTWLPLEVLRDGATLSITARFPQQFE